MIQKVSAVYSASTSTTSQTELARRLTPPSKLPAPKRDNYSYNRYLPNWYHTKEGIRFLALLILAVIVWLAIFYYLIPVTKKSLPVSFDSIPFLDFMLFGLWSIIIVSIISIPLGILVRIVERVETKPTKESVEVRKAEQRAADAYWQDMREFERAHLAHQYWKELFYCARCDGVFLEQSKLVSPEQMESFLYKLSNKDEERQ